MTLVNLTPHAINLPGLTVEPSGKVARCAETVEDRGFRAIGGSGVKIPIIAKRVGNIEGLPPIHLGPAADPTIYYIVSALVAQAAWATGRDDVVCPGNPVRDKGNVIGAGALCVMP